MLSTVLIDSRIKTLLRFDSTYRTHQEIIKQIMDFYEAMETNYEAINKKKLVFLKGKCDPTD